MATLLTEVYGSKSGTNASKFQAYAAIRYTETDPVKGYYIQARRYLLYSPGSGYGGGDGFMGTVFWCNWGGNFSVYGNDYNDGGSKVYGDTGWVNVGWVEPEKTYSVKAECGYTSSSMGELKSSATATATVEVVLAPPAAPTLMSPASSSVVSGSEGSVTFEWAHNATDKTAQAAAELQHSTDGGSTWTTVKVSGSAQSAKTSMFPANSTVLWRVRTKGSHDEYGAWSENRIFYVYNPPSVSFTEPTDGGVVATMPIRVAFDYGDVSGVLVASTLSIRREGTNVYSLNLDAVTETLIEAGEWLPENGQSYVLHIEVRSSSTLTATATCEVTVDFARPMLGTAAVIADPETGCADLVLDVIQDASLEDVAGIDLWRVFKGTEVLIASGLQPGDTFSDKYAPLNVPYRYKVASYTEAKAYSSNFVSARIDTPWWFIYHKDGMARGMWEPIDGISAGKPNDQLVYLDNREWPVLLQTANRSYQRSVSAWVETQEEVDAFEAVNFSSGGCVFKSLRGGAVFHCTASAQIDLDMDYMEDGANVSVTITRIDGGAL